MPVSSRPPRAATCSGASPSSTPPLGTPVTRLPAGVITSSSSPRSTTPPYDVSNSVDIVAQRVRVMDREASATLRDHACPFQCRQEPGGGLTRRSGEHREIRLGGGGRDVGRRRPVP